MRATQPVNSLIVDPVIRIDESPRPSPKIFVVVSIAKSAYLDTGGPSGISLPAGLLQRPRRQKQPMTWSLGAQMKVLDTPHASDVAPTKSLETNEAGPANMGINRQLGTHALTMLTRFHRSLDIVEIQSPMALRAVDRRPVPQVRRLRSAPLTPRAPERHSRQLGR